MTICLEDKRTASEYAVKDPSKDTIVPKIYLSKAFDFVSYRALLDT
jgi:hypothetical protein